MDSETSLDAALRRVAETPDDAAARLDMHAELSRAELFVLLEAEVTGDRMAPRVFELSEGRAVLAFASEMRLAEFAGAAAAYAALPGRVLVTMLAEVHEGEPLSLLVNPDADHAAFLPHEALVWLAQTLAAPAPQELRGTPRALFAPDLPAMVLDRLVPALERRLGRMPGLARAVLAAVDWAEGGRGHLLALSGLPETAHPPVARAVAEALALSGLDAAALDVVFPSEAMMARIAACGVSLSPEPFEIPADQMVTPQNSPGANPGLDPDRPPKLS